MHSETNWKFFLRTSEAWEAMLEACEEAKFSIDIEQFIMSPDTIGMKLVGILKRKLEEGVKVRLLCDTAGSYYFYLSGVPAELASLGAEVRFFNITSPWKIKSFTSWFFRDHRKIMVVDSEKAFIGGVGFRDDMSGWRDTHVEISGDIISEIKDAFGQMWKKAHKKIFFRFKKQKNQSGDFGLLTNSPRFRQRHIYHRLVDEIINARETVHLTTAYFSPDHRFLRVIKFAARRGVDVKLILPERSDVKIADLAARSLFHGLLKSGVKIYLYKNSVLHAKTAVIDKRWATLGSFNLDNQSFTFNYEANIESRRHSFSAELEKHFETDLENCREVKLEDWNRRPVIQKLLEFFAGMFGEIL